MRVVRLGRTNKTVSAIGLGTWAYGGPRSIGKHSVGWSGHDDRQARRAMIEAHATEIDHWDTADVYGDGQAERLIGTVWSDVPRSDIFLASKVGWDPGPYGRYYDPRLIRERAERSLELLETDYLDLYYLHHCDFGPGDRYLAAAVEALQRLKAEGKILFLGLSDWDSSKLLGIARVMEPDVIQVYRNVVDDQYRTSGLKKWVDDNDVGAVFFSPLKHGLLLGKYDRPTTFERGDMRRGVPEFGDQRVLEALRRARAEVTRRFGSHPQPVLHALTGALLTNETRASVLIGQRSPRQVRHASQLGTALDPADAAWIRALYSDCF